MQRLQRFVRKQLRVVLDTNILISASIIPHGAPARIVLAALDGNLTLVVSDHLLDEYLDVIERPHIRRKYQTETDRVQDIILYLYRDALQVSTTEIPRVVPDDAKDDFILACAVKGKAHYIVSGDEHLLKLKEYRGIKILTPRDFVEQVLAKRIGSTTSLAH